MLERTTVLAKNTEGRTSTGLLSFEEEQALARAVKAARAARERLAQATDLSPEERAELERLIAEGERARQRLVEANQGLVWQIARRYADAGMDVEDLVQEGNIGLLHAIEKFDPDLGYRFSTYATWWIRQAVSRALSEQARTIRVPVHMVEVIHRLGRTERELLQMLGRDPLPAEIAIAVGLLSEEDEIRLAQVVAGAEAARLPAEKRRGLILQSGVAQKVEQLPPSLCAALLEAAARVEQTLHVAQQPVSLGAPLGPEEDAELGDFIEDRLAQPPLEYAAQETLRAQLGDRKSVV